MSSKSLSSKLFLKQGYRVLLIDEPEGYREILSPLPEDIEISTSPEGKYDVIQVFCKNSAELESKTPKLIAHLKEGAFLWISYPKGSSKVPTDINRDSIWAYAKGQGLKAVHQISIDATWSSMRFRRIES